MANKMLENTEKEAFFKKLEERFKMNVNRHTSIKWEDVVKKLSSNPSKLWSLYQMEITGGEPDVVGYDKKTEEFIFFDCCAESPKERRSFCYDEKALEQRKEHKPKDSALHLAKAMGVELLSEEQYRELQSLGEFDKKTSSWILTPDPIRKLGGAMFGDRRYDHVFFYHNGAESYYASRGFRTFIKI